MKILGIDPGMAIVGYSIVEFDGNACTLLHSGSIQTSKNAKESARLLEIFNDMKTIVEMYKPDIASIEKLFFFSITTFTHQNRCTQNGHDHFIQMKRLYNI